ncbi:MAG: DUF881 domain-containing protein [Marmoricola sp.]
MSSHGPGSGRPPRGHRDPDEDEAAGPPTGLTRLRRALLRPSRGQAVVAVLVALVAFAGVTQIHSNDANDTYAGLPQADLVQALNGLSAASRRSQSEIDRLEGTRSQLRSRTQRRSAALRQAHRELDTLGILAGTKPAVGPGIRITVHDPHDQYTVDHLLDGVEELRDAGAEAMQINGQVRIVAQTWFADAQPGMNVDGHHLTPPYVIDAIGNPVTLSRALNFPGGFKDDVKIDNGTTSVTRSDHVVVNVTRSAARPQYSAPAR